MDFNQLDSNRFQILHNYLGDKHCSNVKYVECAINGRMGNILLNIFSTYMFCLKYKIPFNTIIIDKNRKFEDFYTIEHINEYPYMSEIIPFFANIKDHLIDFNDQLQKQINLFKARSSYIEISLNANQRYTSFEKYKNIDFNEFEYIKINYFNLEYSDLEFYDMPDNRIYLGLFQNLFMNNKIFCDIYSQYFKDLKKYKRIIGYSIRNGIDFRKSFPKKCLQTQSSIISDINGVTKNGDLIYIFSDDINTCYKILNGKFANIKFHTNVNPYVDLCCLALCDGVYGNKYSSFVSCAKILNKIIRINRLEIPAK